MSEELLNNVKDEIHQNNKKVRIAINGFGRIGRMIFRAGFEDSNVEFVTINDLGGVESARYYLQHDSSQGNFHKTVEIDGDYLVIGDKRIKVISQRDIHELPWKEDNIDVVAECTGVFSDVDKARIHIEKGAKKVLISAPGKGDCFYFVRGVNDYEYHGQDVVSNGSCTTNSMSALLYAIHKKYGVKQGLFSTVHSVTGDQRILDAEHKDFRRGRAGPFNIIPTTTGAAKAVVKLIPELDGKLHGVAYRVPTPTGSVTDLNIELNQEVSTEELNEFIKHISSTDLVGVLEYSEDELVSTDIIHNPHSGIVDSKMTQVINGNLAKLVVWYDNEWGFSNRMVEVMKIMGNS
ncbi:MAG: type I glyceraldehyde-3-phosphate dehydrogenase [Candidatus Nanoarchaeia archaeon]